MVNIIEKDGIITLDGDTFDLKIDNNRRVYVKHKNEKIYRGIDEEVEIGMSAYEKKKYLYELYQMMQKKLLERSQQVTSNPPETGNK